MLKRTIPEIEIEYTWSRPVESIVVDLGPRIPREIIPDMIHDIYRFFNLSKNEIYPAIYNWKDDKMYLIQHEDGTFHCPECDKPAFKENGCFYHYIGKRRSKCCRAFFSEHAMSKRQYRKLIRSL